MKVQQFRMTRRALTTWAELVGAELTKDAGGTFELYAPPGYVWSASGTAALVADTINLAGSTFVADALFDLTERARCGLRKCTPAESAEKEHELDEPWTAAPNAPETIAGPVGPFVKHN